MVKCPSCDRKFETFEDYPYVYVSQFERLTLPHNMEFPYFHGILDHMESVPREVRDFLAKESKVFSKVKRVFCKGDEPVKGISKLGPCLDYDDRIWVSNRNTGLVCFSRDEKEIIFSHIDSYLGQIQELVQETVRPAALLPNLSRYSSSDLLFAIPDSGYNLAMGKDLLRRLGWFEKDTEEFYEKLADPHADKQKIVSDMRKETSECEKSADGADIVSLYIIGLRPVDTSSMFGITAGERFKVKVAEFAYKGIVDSR